MRYRVGGPLIDSLMAELGMDGSSLNGLLAGGVTSGQAPAERTASNGGAGEGGSLSTTLNGGPQSTDSVNEGQPAPKAPALSDGSHTEPRSTSFATFLGSASSCAPCTCCANAALVDELVNNVGALRRCWII